MARIVDLRALLVALCAVVAAGSYSSTASSTASGRVVKKILHFSDVHLNISASFKAEDSAGFPYLYGQDAPVSLLESALTYAQQVLPHPDLFLYTGDHVAHGLFSDEYIAKALETNVKTIERFYSPRDSEMLETTAIIGNADGNPDYYMEVTNPNSHVNPSIKKISKIWGESLLSKDFEAFNRRGYLTYELDEKLTVLTLNTVPYSPSHLPDTSGIEDPFGQFAWLNTTLASLQNQGKFAYITGHIAPIVDSYGGNPQWNVNYIATYKSIVGKYASVIKAQMFGHVHSVEFRVPSVSLDASATGFELVPLFVSGSISPLFGNNPSFMVWDYDAETYDVLDYVVYGTNISEVDQKLDWQLLFTASEAYGLKSLSNLALTDFYQRVEADPALLEEYYWNMKAQSHRTPPCATDLCRAKTMCSLKWWTTKGEFLACVDGATSTSSLVNTIINKGGAGGGGAGTGAAGTSTHYTLAPSDVYMAIVMTVIATVVVLGLVFAVMHGLKRSGVLETSEYRDREKENFFPML